MERLIAYIMAAAVGLVLAVAVAVPSMQTRARQATGETGAPRVYRTDRPPVEIGGEPVPGSDAATGETADAAPAPTDNQTILATDAASGSLSLTLNGHALEAPQAGQPADVSPLVHPGKNVLCLSWTSPVQAEVTVRHATQAGEFRDAAEAFLIPADTQSPGQRYVTFYL